MDGSTVQVRVHINEPENLTADLFVSGYVKGDAVEAAQRIFQRFFGNVMQVVHFDQTGSWGQIIKVAEKVDLSGMDTGDLRFYTYDRQNSHC